MAEIAIRVSDRALRATGIVVGGIVLASAFLYLWSSGVFVPKYQLRVYLPELSGLAVHTQVRLDGVPVGSVTAIKLAGESASPERRVELVLRVDKRYQDAIRSDAVASTAADSLLGARYVSIRRGFKGSVINSDGEIQFLPAPEISYKDVLKAVERTVNCSQADKNSSENKAQVPPETPAKTDR
ncbi:MAG: MCE family protein [Candidatus Acidiferrales bacterium]